VAQAGLTPAVSAYWRLHRAVFDAPFCSCSTQLVAFAIRNRAATDWPPKIHELEGSESLQAQLALDDHVICGHLAHRVWRVLLFVRPQGLRRLPDAAVVFRHCRWSLRANNVPLLGHHHNGSSGRTGGGHRLDFEAGYNRNLEVGVSIPDPFRSTPCALSPTVKLLSACTF